MKLLFCFMIYVLLSAILFITMDWSSLWLIVGMPTVVILWIIIGKKAADYNREKTKLKMQLAGFFRSGETEGIDPRKIAIELGLRLDKNEGIVQGYLLDLSDELLADVMVFLLKERDYPDKVFTDIGKSLRREKDRENFFCIIKKEEPAIFQRLMTKKE